VTKKTKNPEEGAEPTAYPGLTNGDAGASPVTAAGASGSSLDTRGNGDDPLNTLLAGNPSLWRGCDMAGQGNHGLPTGYPQLDNILPGRGWPRNAIVEIISYPWGMGELQLLIPLMREVVKQGHWILWVSPPYLLNSPALSQAGVNPEQVLLVNLDASCRDALWSMEKALQTASCGLVLAWQNWLPAKVVRRLQLAAAAGKTLGILFQHKNSKHSQPSLRLEIKGFYPGKQAPSGPGDHPGYTEITVLKARGNFRPLSVKLNLYQEGLPLLRTEQY